MVLLISVTAATDTMDDCNNNRNKITVTIIMELKWREQQQ